MSPDNRSDQDMEKKYESFFKKLSFFSIVVIASVTIIYTIYKLISH